MKKFLTAILTVILFTSCASAPRIETYILDATVQQDFIRPSGLKNAILDSEMDFTVKTDKSEIIRVVVNFSLLKGKEALLGMEQASFVFDNNEVIPLSDIVPLFIDRNKNVSRYSSLISPENFKQLIQQNNPRFRVVIKAKTYDFKPTAEFMTQLRGAKTQYIY